MSPLEPVRAATALALAPRTPLPGEAITLIPRGTLKAVHGFVEREQGSRLRLALDVTAPAGEYDFYLVEEVCGELELLVGDGSGGQDAVILAIGAYDRRRGRRMRPRDRMTALVTLGAETFEADVIDVGEGGVALAATRRIGTGTPVRYRLRFAAGRESVGVQGLVTFSGCRNGTSMLVVRPRES